MYMLAAASVMNRKQVRQQGERKVCDPKQEAWCLNMPYTT